MATANYCNQQSDYVSKILTEKRKVSLVLLRFTKSKLFFKSKYCYYLL